MVLDRDICALVAEGRMILEPWDSTMVQPASIDACLDRYFRPFNNRKHAMVGLAKEQPELTRLFDSGDKPLILHLSEFVPGSIFEHVTLLDNIAAWLEGEPSLGHLGLLTHSTTGFIDLGLTGHIALEPSSTATMPIALYPGMKIG